MRTPANVLSGGELARLLLARLSHLQCDMDEPTNDLDLETLDLAELIADYQEQSFLSVTIEIFSIA